MVERTLANALPDCPECGGELSVVAGPPASFRCDRFSCGKTYPASALLAPEVQIRLNELITRVTDIAADTPEPIVRGREYAHVMVDEAQDLSPMQWRMLARRSPSRSMTIVGDLGQASTPWAPDSWTHALEELDVDVRHADLSVNYRTPREVMAVAADVLAAASPNLVPPTSVRSSGQWPEHERVAQPGDLESTAVAAARRVVETHRHGRVAVIAPADLRDSLRAELQSEADPLDSPIAVLSVDEAKGLEFDGVVLVEPAHLVADDPAGLRALYVALTRATQEVVIVHHEDLQRPLADAL
jgi:DNA helicase IV